MGDTPQTVMTTRAPAVLKINQSRIEWGLQNGMYGSMVINDNVGEQMDLSICCRTLQKNR